MLQVASSLKENPEGISIQESHTYPNSVLQVLVPKFKIPDAWVHGPSGEVLEHSQHVVAVHFARSRLLLVGPLPLPCDMGQTAFPLTLRVLPLLL